MTGSRIGGPAPGQVVIVTRPEGLPALQTAERPQPAPAGSPPHDLCWAKFTCPLLLREGTLGGWGGGARQGAVQAQGQVREDREGSGSTGLLTSALQGEAYRSPTTKLHFCYGRRQPLAQKVKAIKATQNFNSTAGRGAPGASPHSPRHPRPRPGLATGR